MIQNVVAKYPTVEMFPGEVHKCCQQRQCSASPAHV
jgi:hypothetical protein